MFCKNIHPLGFSIATDKYMDLQCGIVEIFVLYCIDGQVIWVTLIHVMWFDVGGWICVDQLDLVWVRSI